MIHELLSRDGIYGVSMRRLMRWTGHSKYFIETQIERERRQGWPIVTSRHSNPRYYLASNKAILERYIKRTQIDIRKKQKTVENCEELLKTWKAAR